MLGSSRKCAALPPSRAGSTRTSEPSGAIVSSLSGSRMAAKLGFGSSAGIGIVPVSRHRLRCAAGAIAVFSNLAFNRRSHQ